MLPYDLLGQAAAGPAPNPLRFVIAEPRAPQTAPVSAEAQIRPLEEVIRMTIERAIDASDGSIPRAAAALDVSPSTLYRRIEGWKGIVALAASDLRPWNRATTGTPPISSNCAARRSLVSSISAEAASPRQEKSRPQIRQWQTRCAPA